jgi:hypothetical protein
MLGHIAHFFSHTARVTAKANPLRVQLSLLKGIRPLRLIVVVIMILSVFVSLVPTNAGAASTVSCPNTPTEASGGNYSPKTGGCTPSDEATSISYYAVLSTCVGANMQGVITSTVGDGANPKPTVIFDGGTAVASGNGFIYPGAAKTTCADVLTAAMSLWGFSNTGAFLKAMGDYTPNAHDKTGDSANPEYVQDGRCLAFCLPIDASRVTAFQTAVTKQVYQSSSPKLSDAAKYSIAFDAFTRRGKFDTNIGQDDTIAQCNAQDLGDITDPKTSASSVTAAKANKTVKNDAAGDYSFIQNVSAARTYTDLRLIDSTGTPSVHAYAYLSGKDYGASTSDILSAISSGGTSILFSQLAGAIKGSSNDTALTHAETIAYNIINRVVPSCISLVKSVNTYAIAFRTWQIANKGIQGGGGGGDGACVATSTTTCDNTTSCVVDGVGWLVCPLMNAIGGLNDAMYGWVQSVLVLNPLTQNDSTGAATPQYQNWSIIRNIANVLLVIAFLIIIFSQISSIGISNYGVKKMLPRVILVAVAINLSWILMSLAIDVVNILGVGLHTLLDATAVSGTTSSLNFAAVTTALVSGGIITAGVTGLAVALILPAAALSGSTLVLLALPFLLGAVLALLAAVATLFLRNAIIIVLVIIAPVALVAYLLPNTEQYFKQWRKLFVSMLMLFPMAALLFAGCKFAAYILLTSSQPFNIITALFVMAAPLGLLPWLARSSGGILSTVNQRLGGMAKSLQGASQKALARRVETQKNQYRAGTKNFLGLKRDPATKLNKDGTLKQTKAQKWATTAAKLDNLNENSKKVIVENYKQIGLRDKGAPGTPQTRAQRKAMQIAGIVDAGKTADLASKATDAQYDARLQGRQLQHNSPEQALTHKLDDAEGAIKRNKSRLEQENLGRINSGAMSTVAHSIGDPTLLNLRDVSNATNVAEHAVSAIGAEIQQTNDESGDAALYIEREKEAKFGSEVVGEEQNATFNDAKNTEAGLVDLANRQDVAKKASGAAEHELEAKVEGEAERGLDSREANKLRQQTAEEQLATFKADEEAKLAARRSPTGGIDPVTGLPDGSPGDLYNDYTREQEESKLEKEKQEAAQKAAYGARQSDPGDLQGLADAKTVLEESSAAGAAAAKARIDAAKMGKKKDGKLMPIAGMDTAVLQGLADAGRGQAIASRNSTLASGVADVLRGKEINNDPGGELSRQMAGIDLGISDNTRLEDANAAKVTQADLRGDKESYDELHKRENLSSKDLYENVLGMSSSEFIVPDQVKAMRDEDDDMPLAEELSAIEDIQQHGGADDQDNLFDYSSQLTLLALQAEKNYKDNPTEKNRIIAEKSRLRSKTIHTSLQRGWSTSSALRPMQYGGSLEQTFANDTETRNKREIQADRLGGGKYDHTIGTRNIDQLKALEKQLKDYATGASSLETDFSAAFLPGAKYTVSHDHHLNPGDTGYDEKLKEVHEDKVEKAKTELASFLLQLDKALDDPDSPPLSPEKITKLGEIRTDLLGTLEKMKIPRPGDVKDPVTGKFSGYKPLPKFAYHPTSQYDGNVSSEGDNNQTTPSDNEPTPPATPPPGNFLG